METLVEKKVALKADPSSQNLLPLQDDSPLHAISPAGIIIPIHATSAKTKVRLGLI